MHQVVVFPETPKIGGRIGPSPWRPGPDCPTGAAGRAARAHRASPALHPGDAESRQAFQRPHDQSRPLGWVSDRGGYRYQARHPVTGKPWPPMPSLLLELWRSSAVILAIPRPALSAIMVPAPHGLHRDEDEADLAAPVVSLSLGDTALFRFGGPTRGDRTRSSNSPPATSWSWAARAALLSWGRPHSVRLSTLLPEGGRINLTLRRVTLPAGPVIGQRRGRRGLAALRGPALATPTSAGRNTRSPMR